jgi:uncharacterized protein YndB with AHSA1/START domain
MPIVSVASDPVALTLTVVGEYPVPLERLWAAWANPREVERFWGPPTWPATFTRHDMAVGGQSLYRMTGPNGESSGGYWRFLAVEPGRSFEVEDGFCLPDGTPNHDMPGCRMLARFESTSSGARFTLLTRFPSVESMEQLVAIGMMEGMRAALGQMDDVVADLRERSAGPGTELVVVDDTHVRITRDVRGSLRQVWRAHSEAALIQRWMLGPPGWTMPVCEVATEVGQTYRYEWAAVDGGASFGFTGELLESKPPRRSVTTETMIGMEGPGTVNELVLSPLPGDRTRIVLLITYPSKELRDLVLGTGMVDGMESSYARLESVLSV